MSKDKWRNAAYQVIVDMLELHNPDDPDLPQAYATRTRRGATLTLVSPGTPKILGAYRIELVSLKQTDEWTHVIMQASKTEYGVVISRHRTAKAAADCMSRRSLTRLLGYEIYTLTGDGRAIEVGDKLHVESVNGEYYAHRPKNTEEEET